ncbi:hypothetical protein K0A97_03120 [Patescibacteria group bacterium]|nr:hypothetical protein [Patescibacteria group bacterium]
MKRGKIITIMMFSLLLVIPLISAGFFSDLWGQVTGWATKENVTVTITVGNAAPTIPIVETISLQSPVESGTKSIEFYFTVQDENGVSDINDSTAKAYFQRIGETTRYNESCVAGSTSGNRKNYTCIIDMWYFDEAGDWTINVSIKDNSEDSAENSSTTFQYNELTSMALSPKALTWPGVGPSSTDIGSDNDPIVINNTGNADGLEVNVTALDLIGVPNSGYSIFANNFTVDIISTGCSGDIMQNDTAQKITSAALYRGNNTLNYNNQTSGQETLYFCLKGLPTGILAQDYTTAGLGPWITEVIG